MAKTILAVIVGFALWSVLWLAGGAALQKVFADVVSADGATSDPTALATILLLSVVCSFASGFVASVIAGPGRRTAGVSLGILLLAVGIMVQASAWSQLPVWYHLSFLVLLLPVTLMGAAARRPQTPRAQIA